MMIRRKGCGLKDPPLLHLLDPSPVFSGYDVMYGHKTNTKGFRQIVFAFPGIEPHTNVKNFFGCKLALSNLYTSRLTPFAVLVIGIVLKLPQKQVLWIYAARIVTPMTKL
jgi:hypothetical protein